MQGKEIDVILVYVNDLVIYGNSLSQSNSKGIVLYPRKYAILLIFELSLFACNTVKTPVQLNLD